MALTTTMAQSLFGLELEGVFVGAIASFAGGDATADVDVGTVGTDGIAHKQLGAITYPDIHITCGADMADSFYDWLRNTFTRKISNKNGALVTYDLQFNEVARLSFFNALVTEIGFPAPDASSKDAAKLTIRITPEHTRDDSGNSRFQTAVSIPRKRWIAQNFRLTIDGVSYPTVAKVEAITISRPVASGSKDQRNQATHVVVPDLTITLDDRSTDTGVTTLRNWFNSFVIAGINGQEQEKSGTLEYLTSDGSTALFTLDLRQLGIYRLSRLNDGNTRRLQARMYCEQIMFSYASNATVTTTSQSSGSSSDNQTTLPTLTMVSSPFLQDLSLPPANQSTNASAPNQRLMPSAASRAPRNLTAEQSQTPVFRNLAS